MEKFNLQRFLTEGEPKMLCMLCKRYDCKRQSCPGDDNEAYVTSGGYNCEYFQTPSTPVSDGQAYDAMFDILVSTEPDYTNDSLDTIKAKLGERRCYMERIMVEILKQYGYDKTVKAFEDQGFDLPF